MDTGSTGHSVSRRGLLNTVTMAGVLGTASIASAATSTSPCEGPSAKRFSSFAGPLQPIDDLALTAPLREDPAAIETYNVWLFDPDQNVAINLHPTLQHGEMLTYITVFLPDGKILRGLDERAKFTSPKQPHSKNITYTCEEPFRRWKYSGRNVPVFVTSDIEQGRGAVEASEPTLKVSFDIDAITKAPPYIQGTLLPEAKVALQDIPGLWMASRLTSGPSPVARRYDQALEGNGTITVGDQSYTFHGFGLRGHVRGVRVMDGMEGHSWIGAVFPSGMCMGIQAYPRSDGGYAMSEAYIYKDGIVYPNRIIYASRFNRDPAVRRFVVELACDELGRTRFVGEDRRTFYWAMSGWSGQPSVSEQTRSNRLRYGIDPAAPMIMRQAVATFECNGETGAGMHERSGSAATSEKW